MGKVMVSLEYVTELQTKINNPGVYVADAHYSLQFCTSLRSIRFTGILREWNVYMR